jgi:hypothetical protein
VRTRRQALHSGKLSAVRPTILEQAMSDSPTAGFGKFVPGFDFLQNLAKGASQTIPQMPNLANWVAPSLNPEELEKRIDELKAVHFWLEQNSRALGATIQALEVQKMTLATLKGMNFNLADVANAFTLKPADAAAGGMQRASEKAASTTRTSSDAASTVGGAARAAPKSTKSSGGAAALVDPMQLWGALTQQFQQIAAGALKDASRNAGMDASKNMAADFAQDAVKAGKKLATGNSTARPAAKKSARKTATRPR